MKYKLILLSILFSILSGKNFYDNKLNNYKFEINKIKKNFIHLKRKFINYNESYLDNEIKLNNNYNPFFININNNVHKVTKEQNNIKKKKKSNNIFDIKPLIIFNNKVYIKYLIIDVNNKKIISKRWIKIGEKINNCKLVKIYYSGDLLFKCGKKYIRYKNSPKLNIKGKK